MVVDQSISTDPTNTDPLTKSGLRLSANQCFLLVIGFLFIGQLFNRLIADRFHYDIDPARSPIIEFVSANYPARPGVFKSAVAHSAYECKPIHRDRTGSIRARDARAVIFYHSDTRTRFLSLSMGWGSVGKRF